MSFKLKIHTSQSYLIILLNLDRKKSSAVTSISAGGNLMKVKNGIHTI